MSTLGEASQRVIVAAQSRSRQTCRKEVFGVLTAMLGFSTMFSPCQMGEVRIHVSIRKAQPGLLILTRFLVGQGSPAVWKAQLLR